MGDSGNNRRPLVLESWQKFLNEQRSSTNEQDDSTEYSGPCSFSLHMDQIESPPGTMKALLESVEEELSKQQTLGENKKKCTNTKKPSPPVLCLPKMVDLQFSSTADRRSSRSLITLETKDLLIDFFQKCQIQELRLVASPPSSNILLGTMELRLAADLEKVASLTSLSIRGFPPLTPFLFSCLSARNCRITELLLMQHPTAFPLIDSVSSAVSERQMEDLQAALQTLGGISLEKVHVAQCDLRGNRLVSFLSAFRHCGTLKHLILGEECALPTSLDAIAWFLESHDMLETLKVSMNDDAIESYLVLDVDMLVEAIFTHSNLKHVKIPLWPCQARLATDLMFVCSQSSVLQSVYLDIASLEKHTPPGKDQQEIHLNVFDFGAEAEEWLPLFMERIPHIPNITALNTTGDCSISCNLVKNIFVEDHCRISDLSLFYCLDRDEFDLLEQGLSGYEGLKKLVLNLEHPFTVRNLCRNSELEKLTLLLEHGDFTIMQSCALLLEGQPKLLRLEIVKYGTLDEDVRTDDESEAENEHPVQRDDPRQTIAYRAFANALQAHSSLESLTIGRNGCWNRKSFNNCIKHIVGAIEHNTTIQSLDLSDSDLSVGSLTKALPQLHLKELLLPASDFSKRDWKQLLHGMALNVSILCIQPSWLMEPLSREHDKISKLLKRNQLVAHAACFLDKLELFPKSLWPSILSKLGSNQKEASPVFCFVKAGAEFLGTVVPCKKRRR